MSELIEVFRGAGTYVDSLGRRYRLDSNGMRVPLKDAPKEPEAPISHPRGGNKPSSPKSNLGSNLRSFLAGKPKKIESSYLAAAKFDSENSILRLAFIGHPGVWHPYKGVTKEEAEDFFKAPSKGKWFHEKIKGKGSKKGEHIKDYLGKEEENA